MSLHHAQKGKQACTQKAYFIKSQDLPLSCPPRDERIWDAHPRVYLPIEELGEVRCPYCGANYFLEKS
ncbi:MAG TPA: zinc-finger domain-containing protein [Gammaproteobacteria bacterium]|nr:zinc-finger domain-containing protein [Gammaproteobacteria bacterium]